MARAVASQASLGVLTCRRQGHPGSPGAGTFIRSCMPHGVRHSSGETGRQSPCRGRAARILARTIRMPPVSSIWIPGRRWAPAPGHPTVRNPVGGHARERHGGAGRRGPDDQGAGGYGCPGASIFYLGITLSDERGEGERAHCRRSVVERSVRSGPLEGRRTVFSVVLAVAAPR
jgi:hypothetical protein